MMDVTFWRHGAWVRFPQRTNNGMRTDAKYFWKAKILSPALQHSVIVIKKGSPGKTLLAFTVVAVLRGATMAW